MLHFTVVHSWTFKQVYKEGTTGEVVNAHTNKIEGSWKHVKKHKVAKEADNEDTSELKQRGYKHFTVVHSWTFKQVYKDGIPKDGELTW